MRLVLDDDEARHLGVRPRWGEPGRFYAFEDQCVGTGSFLYRLMLLRSLIAFESSMAPPFWPPWDVSTGL